MDLDKIAEASHQAWFVAMAKQNWTFGPRANFESRHHPWLKPFASLNDSVKDVLRAQARGTLAYLESQGGALALTITKSQPAPTQAAIQKPQAPVPVSTPAQARQAPVPAPVTTPAVVASSEALEVLERKVDSSGRMRIGAGIVKKAGLLSDHANQVAIIYLEGEIRVLPAADGPVDAFLASVNPDGFMMPKAILASAGAASFNILVFPGRLVVRPK